METKQKFLIQYTPLAKRLIKLLKRKHELDKDLYFCRGDLDARVDSKNRQSKKVQKELTKVSQKLMVLYKAVERIDSKAYRNIIIDHFWREEKVKEDVLAVALAELKPTQAELDIILGDNNATDK